MSKTELRETHIKEIDYLRGFAILAVLMIHISANFTNLELLNNLMIFNILIDVFAHYAVPLFIFISGFVLSIKYYGLFSLKSFYQKRIKSIIPHYIIFSILYIIFYSIITNPPTFILIVFKILTANSSYHLWFFAILIEFYIFYPFIIKIYHDFEKKGKINIFLMLSLFIQVMWTITILLLQTLINNSLFTNLTGRIFIPYLFYFTLGIYFSRNLNYVYKSFKSKKIYSIVLFFISIFLTIIISMFWIKGIIDYNYFYGIPKIYFVIPIIIEVVYYPIIFILLFEISRYLMKRKNIIASSIYLLGKYSFGIYLIHVFFIRIAIKLFGYVNIDFNNWIFYPLLFIITIVLSLFSTYFISYFPYGKLIVGVSNRKSSQINANINLSKKSPEHPPDASDLSVSEIRGR